mmetsp:Transcript_42336/g.48092  ORF Transcript_42336/g.48092 Transcript_42336/m.48092 type:complete len:373 (-) Transcript_42336:33-1151(-)
MTGKKDCIESVTLLKRYFQERNTVCDLCNGNQGGFHKCSVGECNRWFHVTCARAYDRCEVIHGENCEGPVKHKPWTLSCPEHSNIETLFKNENTSDQHDLPAQVSLLEPEIKKPKVKIEKIKMKSEKIKPKIEKLKAKVERPRMKSNKHFGKLTGKERSDFLKDLKNERMFVDEVLSNKLHGVRCEVCFALEPEGKNLTKCSVCSVVFCISCSLSFDKIGRENNSFTCQACQFVGEQLKTRDSVKEIRRPNCVLCFQRGGWLRKAKGFPPDFRMKKFQRNPKEYEKTIFGKLVWVHTLCYLWHYPEIEMDETNEEVNLSKVIMSHGKGFIRETNHYCELCGRKEGLKKRCQDQSCRRWGHEKNPDSLVAFGG